MKRKDGFFELPWYKHLRFMVTKANSGKGWDVVLTGPSASGKTTAGYMVAHDLGYEVIVQQCRRGMEAADFRGSRSIVSNKQGMPITGFDAGTVTRAVQHATEYQRHGGGYTDKKKYRGVVLVVDEVTTVDAGMLALFNNLTQRDAHSILSVPELGIDLPRPPNLIIVGTMNPEYIGTGQLSEAFQSRVVLIECPMMSVDQVRTILSDQFPNNKSMTLAAARIMGFIEAARLQESHQWQPDLRTMQQFLDLWTSCEPDWSRGKPLNAMADAFDFVIGPKIGWRESFATARAAVRNAIITALGGTPASLDPEENGGFVPITDDDLEIQ